MISRCYATAICDTEYGILNTTIINGSNEKWESDNVVPSSNLITDNSNQQETSQINRPLSEIQPTRPIPIWQLLLLRNRLITEAKSFPIVRATESNKLAEVQKSEKSSKGFGNMEITERNNSKEMNIKNTPEYTREIITEEITTTTTTSTKQNIPKKDQNEVQAKERLWLLYKALQQMDKNADCLKQQ
uniref:Uncharacterized protein n=1 Tax=Loa loa TaxID=7209 RepID=A0A1I7V5M2_LOALO